MADHPNFQKDPADIKDFGINWEKEMTFYADTISASTWTAESGITIQSSPAPSFTTTKATVWLSGGTAGTNYRVTNRIVTTGGRTYERSIRVMVAER